MFNTFKIPLVKLPLKDRQTHNKNIHKIVQNYRLQKFLDENGFNKLSDSKSCKKRATIRVQTTCNQSTDVQTT